MPDETGQKQALTQFQPGQSGNPSGRPKGSRNKLGESFLAAIQTDFEEHGAAVIERVRTEDPSVYLRVVASILPKQVELDAGSFGNLSDEHIRRLVQAVDAWLTAHPDEGSGAGILPALPKAEDISRPRGDVH